MHINRVTWVLHQQGSSLAQEKVGEINAPSVIYQVCVCGSSPTLAELPKHPVFGIPMKMDLKRLQMSWCNISSPRKLLRSTFLGLILNFRSVDMGMAVSTGLEVTRQGAITWGKKAVERQDHWVRCRSFRFPPREVARFGEPWSSSSREDDGEDE